MVFVILKLDGPLFSLDLQFFSGLTTVVGINSAIRLPTAETVFGFPFKKPSNTLPMSDGPLASLKTVLWPPPDVIPWFTPREGLFWIAARLKATAVTPLSVDAVVVVITNFPRYSSLSLAWQLPISLVCNPSSNLRMQSWVLPLSLVRLLVNSTWTLSFRLAVMLLHESCHLTGGMALYAWAETGDFILTLCGYHQAFVVPTAYPVPPRLGIAWSLSDNLRISGEAYLAMTARMYMGCGKLNTTLNLGPLTA